MNQPGASQQESRSEKFGLAALSIALLLFAGCSRGPGSAAPESKRVESLEVSVAEAEERRVQRTIEVVGSLTADEEIQVSNELPGYLAAVQVDLGSVVRQGQVLAELDKRELQLQAQQVRAALAQARARLGLKEGQEAIEPEETAVVRQARAAWEDAKSRYESALQLAKTGDIARQRFVELEKNYQGREAAYQSAIEDVRAQLAQIQARQAELALAEKRLKDATIRSPISGAVSAKLVSAGQYVKDKTPLLTLVRDSVLRLRIRVPELEAAAVRQRTELSFTTDAYPGRTFRALVTRVGPALDPQARTLLAEASVPNPDHALKPGMFARVTAVVEKSAPTVMVPKAALHELAGLTKIFLVQGDHVVEQRIQSGVSQGDFVEVRGGKLRPGMRVATSHLDRLQDGQAVRVRR